MTKHLFLFLSCWITWVSVGWALTLDLPPRTTEVWSQSVVLDSYALPIAPYDGGRLPAETVTGTVSRQSWHVATSGLTALQLLTPLRDQILAQGYKILLDCHAPDCGGFGFRFETEVLPAPLMHVDLNDFRFVSAHKGRSDHLSLLVSRSESAGFIQMIRVTEGPIEADQITIPESPQAAPAVPTAPSDLAAQLTSKGRVVLSDLSFEPGSSNLKAERFASLLALSDMLRSEPDLNVALVGHTDSIGDLDANIKLSKRRATVVMERLIDSYQVDPSQITAEGMGYLAPVASNQNEEGRNANRRVEAILLNTE